MLLRTQSVRNHRTVEFICNLIFIDISVGIIKLKVVLNEQGYGIIFELVAGKVLGFVEIGSDAL